MDISVKGFVCGMVQTNCYVVTNGNGDCVLIDCEESGGRMEDYLDENGLTPSHILLTHAHSDHIGGCLEMKKRYGAEIWIGKQDEELLLSEEKNLSAMMGNPVSIQADGLASEGDVIACGGLSFQVLETPGHTKGSVCYAIGDILFSGDTLFAGSCGRTDFYSGDMAQMQKSLKRLAALPGDYTVYPGHMRRTQLSYERENNPFMA